MDRSILILSIKYVSKEIIFFVQEMQSEFNSYHIPFI